MARPQRNEGDKPIEMAEASEPVEATAKTQKELEKLYGGADGQLDEIEKMMMKYDADGSGCFSIAEVKSIIHDMESHKKHAKHLGRALVGTIVVGLIVMGMLFALMITSAEAVKENHTKGGSMVDLNGDVVAVGQAEEFSGLFDLPSMGTEVLSTMKTLTFYVDKTTSVEEMTLKVSGASRQVDGGHSVTIHSPAGWNIVIDGDARTGTINMDGQSYPIRETLDGRRLTETDPEWIGCEQGDGGACFPKAPPADWRKRLLKRRELAGRRGSSLMTMSTFSMGASRAGNG